VRNRRESRHSLPHTRRLTIVAQDPSVKVGGNILTAAIEVPAEQLQPGPCGYRVNVIDYDATTGSLYEPWRDGGDRDPFAPTSRGGKPAKPSKQYDRRLLNDPRFHAQNVYAIVMRTLARFEFALGRRVPWGSDGHQLHVVPHAFAEANAFYSRDDRGLFFGYFAGASGKPVFTCLSHDVIAHETTHAVLDGLRSRYLEPSSPDQAAFHEGFSDVVALLSVFSIPGIVGKLLGGNPNASTVSAANLSREALCKSVLLGLADEMGQELSKVRGQALRRSIALVPGKPYMSMPGYDEEHERGELLVAAVMNAFLDIWLARIAKIGFVAGRKRDRSLVVEEGASAAEHLLTMAIRAIDYCPPTDITFPDYLSALLTVDREVVPDDTRYRYRAALLKSFKDFDIAPASDADADGTWKRDDQTFVYSRTRFESLLRDKEEVFRFVWENRKALEIDDRGYVEVQSVRPCMRVGPDGFILRETVAEYIQIMTLQARELKSALGIQPPKDMPKDLRVRIFGGGALIFDEYGQLKYHIANKIEDRKRQTDRLHHLWKVGFFDEPADVRSHFASLHLARAMT